MDAKVYQNTQGFWVSKIPGYVIKDEHVVDLGSKQKDAMKAFIDGTNVLIHGPAGSGKSVTIRRIRQVLVTGKIPHEVCAFTGSAAVNIHGTTIHHIFKGLGLMKGDGPTLYKKLRRKKYVIEKLRRMRVLIIDEISLISASFFDKIDYLLRKATKTDKPFGGKQIVLSGDFYQLPPIDPTAETGSMFAFQSEVWPQLDLKVIDMNNIYRQTDNRFIDILQRMRYGKLVIADLADLVDRIHVKLENDAGVIPTSLFATNADADAVNQSELLKLDDSTHKDFIAQCAVTAKKDIPECDMKTLYKHSVHVRKHAIAPEILSVRVGAQVMLRYNMDVQRGLINGSRGSVIEINETGVTVAFINGHVLHVCPHDFVTEHEFGTIQYKQIPIILAWAMTIHKSQGCTVDSLRLSTNRIHTHGQAYVAFSRCRNLQSLSLNNFDPRCVRASPAVLDKFPPPITTNDDSERPKLNRKRKRK